MNYTQILPKLFVGSCPKGADDINELQQQIGVTAVLNLQTDEDMEYVGCEWPKLSAHYDRARIRVLRMPIEDYDVDELRKSLPECVETLRELINDGCVVYVHCTAGIERSPSVVVTYLHWVERCELQRAVHRVTAHRACSPNLHAIRLASEDLLAG